MNRDNLKDVLVDIKAKDMTIPANINKKELTQSMLACIGDTDPILRDELIYEVLIDFIIEKKLTDHEVRDLVPVLLDHNHLFKDIGGEHEDSVFTRTFSVLILPLILYRHREKGNFLSKETIHQIYDKVMRYSAEEKDLRGYVSTYGWAHSVAHTADALDELALCEEINKDKLMRIMDVIKKKATVHTTGYVFGEEERLTTTVTSIFNRELLSEEYFVDWVEEFGEMELPSQQPNSMYMKNNIRNFLSSLYFRLFDQTDVTPVTNSIKETLKKRSPFY